MDAVGRTLSGSNNISAPLSNPAGGMYSAPVKKLKDQAWVIHMGSLHLHNDVWCIKPT